MSQLVRSLMRFGLRPLRNFFPVLRLGKRTMVFRDADVREVLSRDKDFTLRQTNGSTIEPLLGTFMLGIDDGPELKHESGVMRGIIRKDDPDRIIEFVRRKSEEVLDSLAQQDQFNLIRVYTREVAARMVGNYMGIEGPEDQDQWLWWNRILFWDIFLNLNRDQDIHRQAAEAMRDMNDYITGLIATRKSVLNKGGRLPDDLLSRLLTLQGTEKPQLDDDGIRRNLIGTLLGAIEPISKAMNNILGQFYRRPQVLAAARAAAEANDAEAMGKMAWEALRFHPNAPLLMRFTEKDQTVNGRKIQAGQIVWVWGLSAMFDPRAVEDPREFRIEGRPYSTYLYFGDGLHRCYGEYIVKVVIPQMLIALLKGDRFAPANMKQISGGPFPDQWTWKTT